MDETWKEIAGYEECYMISNLGRVRSLGRLIEKKGSPAGKRITGRILKPKQHHGYNHVCLCKRSVHKYVKIATLVAAAFIGPRPKGFAVCHNNGQRADDRVENLRYDTWKGNSDDSKLHGTMICGEKTSWHKLTESDVRKIREDKRGLKAIATEYGVNDMTIFEAKHRRTWKHVV